MFSTVQRIGFFAGPIVALLIYFALPDQYVDTHKALIPLTFPAKTTICMTVWMAIWWLTEAIDISSTALLPVAMFPLLHIADIKETTVPYASHFIFLFIGGFSIALAMQRWKLDVRLANTVLTIAGNNPKLIIMGFMFSAALLSAFISNTATTAVMLPIGLSIILLFAKNNKDEFENEDQHNFTRCLLLCIAYSASIGGTMTLIGTAPNLFLASFLEEGMPSQYQLELSFIEWASFAAPLAFIFLPIIYIVLTKFIFPFDNNKLKQPENILEGQKGKMDRGQKITIIVFLLTVALWALRPLIQDISFDYEWETIKPFNLLSDSGIAMIAAMLLFIIPIDLKKRVFVMDWKTATQLPWGIFILFGGGLTLAKAIKDNGVAEFFAAQALLLPDLPGIVYVLIVSTSIIFLTELTSNTATTATLVPILASIAIGLGIHPYLLIFPATLAASFAFMMPIATPPNTIVFASGHISIPEMCKAGFWLNVIGAGLITVYTYIVIKPVIGF
ncbi:MAG: SLC13 family permease [Pseudomonadota bacterium]